MAGFLDLLMGGGAGALDPKGQFMADAFMNKRIPGDPVETYHTMLSMLSPDMVNERRRQSDNMGTLVENAGLSPEEAQDFTRQALGLMMSPNQMAEYQAAVAPTMYNMQKFGVEQDLKEREFSEEKRATGVAEGQKDRDLDTKAGRADVQNAEDSADARLKRFEGDVIQDTQMMRQVLRVGQTPDGVPLSQRETEVLRSMLGMQAVNPAKLRLAMELIKGNIEEEMIAGAQILQDELGMDMSDVASTKKWTDGWLLQNGNLFKPNTSTDGMGTIGSMNFDQMDPAATQNMINESFTKKAEQMVETIKKQDKPQEQ